MQPGDYLLMNKKIYRHNEAERGIVVLHSNLTQENGREKLLIKRVIGLPGDTVFIKDNSVYINRSFRGGLSESRALSRAMWI